MKRAPDRRRQRGLTGEGVFPLVVRKVAWLANFCTRRLSNETKSTTRRLVRGACSALGGERGDREPHHTDC